MWTVISFFGMNLTRIFHSCESINLDLPAVTTVIGIVGGILFSLGAIDRKYMDVAPMYVTPELLSLFSIFCGGGR